MTEPVYVGIERTFAELWSEFEETHELRRIADAVHG